MVVLLLAACVDRTPKEPGPSSSTTPTTSPTTSSTTPPPETGDTGAPPVGDPTVLALPPLRTVENGRFSTNDTCAPCHTASAAATAMRDAADRPVGPHDLWRSSMMANSARDPLWRAVVSAEVAATPAAAAAIEAKCLRCHAPMGATDATLLGEAAPGLDVLTDGSDRGHLALDGVSCTMCHQIGAAGLGTEPTFSGGYPVQADGRIYGPHAQPFGHPMEAQTGFAPVQADHVVESELCATCHTLETHALSADGAESGGSVLEQGPYLEWLASDWADPAAGATCAGCHLPTVDEDGVPIVTRIARTPNGGDFPPTSPRSPFGRHVLVGANTLVPAILRDQAAILNPVADAAAFDATIAAARRQLQQATASVAIEAPARDGQALSFAVRVDNHAGHKLPTGIPLRRAWLHVTVEDAGGAVVFESGGWDARGRLLGPDGAPLPSEAVGGPILPHVAEVTGADTVAVYEGVLADEGGAPTFLLMRGAGWAKDSRLLPAGWDAAAADPRTAPVGIAGDGFGPGGDTVRYTVDAGGAAGPLTVRAELVYQVLSARWRAEIVASGTPAALGLDAMLAGADVGPEILTTATAPVP